MKKWIASLVKYAEDAGLISPEDRIYARNAILEVMQISSIEPAEPADLPLHKVFAIVYSSADRCIQES